MDDIQANSAPAEHRLVKGPKALFWFLSLFFTLGITAFSTGGLWFQFINKLFPLAVSSGGVSSPFSQTTLKMQLASLIVAVPAFYIFSLLVRKALKKNELPSENKVRLWITYIILFVVVAVGVGDLITAVFTYLNGDFTTRFFLKCLTILIIVSWIFIYYWLEIKSRDSLIKSNLPKIFGIVTLAVIVASFIGTFFIIESPAVTRLKSFDQTRVGNLMDIKYTIDSYYNEYKKLPADLQALKLNNNYLKLTDPDTQKTYSYRVIDETTYELCAEFAFSNKDIATEEYYYGQEIAHEAGPDCFERKVNDYPSKFNQAAPMAPEGENQVIK